MRVHSELNIGYPECPTRYFNFERFADRAGDFDLIPGIFDFRLLDRFDGRRVVFLEFEEPNRYFMLASSLNRRSFDERFHKVLTLCPYTAEWLNAEQQVSRRTTIFFPFNECHVPPVSAKEFDVIYTGGLHGKATLRMAEIMSRFNYRFVSQTLHPLVTDAKCNYHEKLALIARSRVTIVHNLLHARQRDVLNVLKYPRIRANQAFSQVPRFVPPRFLWRWKREVDVPQLKSRMFEAAFCRSLIFCRRDAWSLAERYFEPDKEFIYFDPEDMEGALRRVLQNYGDYQPVIERAYERAMNEYTTEAFFNRYLKGL